MEQTLYTNDAWADYYAQKDVDFSTCKPSGNVLSDLYTATYKWYNLKDYGTVGKSAEYGPNTVMGGLVKKAEAAGFNQVQYADTGYRHMSMFFQLPEHPRGSPLFAGIKELEIFLDGVMCGRGQHR